MQLKKLKPQRLFSSLFEEDVWKDVWEDEGADTVVKAFPSKFESSGSEEGSKNGKSEVSKTRPGQPTSPSCFRQEQENSRVVQRSNILEKMRVWSKIKTEAIINDSVKCTFSENYGVALFGKDNLKYYVPDTVGGTPTLGAKGRAFFMMPGSDAAKINSTVRAAIETGFSPSVFRAWQEDGDIYGLVFPTKGLKIRLPKKADAMGWRHFLEGGHTAINAEGTNAFMVNSTREFVFPGGSRMPNGSVLFRIDDNGSWFPIWRY